MTLVRLPVYIALFIAVCAIFPKTANAETVYTETELERSIIGDSISNDCAYSSSTFNAENFSYDTVCLVLKTGEEDQQYNFQDKQIEWVRDYDLQQTNYRPFGLNSDLESDRETQSYEYRY